jgi:hypothetical protein
MTDAAAHATSLGADMGRAVPVAGIEHRSRGLLAQTLQRRGLAQDGAGGVIVVSLERQ